MILSTTNELLAYIPTYTIHKLIYPAQNLQNLLSTMDNTRAAALGQAMNLLGRNHKLLTEYLQSPVSTHKLQDIYQRRKIRQTLQRIHPQIGSWFDIPGLSGSSRATYEDHKHFRIDEYILAKLPDQNHLVTSSRCDHQYGDYGVPAMFQWLFSCSTPHGRLVAAEGGRLDVAVNELPAGTPENKDGLDEIIEHGQTALSLCDPQDIDCSLCDLISSANTYVASYRLAHVAGFIPKHRLDLATKVSAGMLEQKLRAEHAAAANRESPIYQRINNLLHKLIDIADRLDPADECDIRPADTDATKLPINTSVSKHLDVASSFRIETREAGCAKTTKQDFGVSMSAPPTPTGVAPWLAGTDDVVPAEPLDEGSTDDLDEEAEKLIDRLRIADKSTP
ncbi:uncharacterized protein B0I36DRAFT_426712 [Microdochium trichocladiopsis]|uniref:Uncharacterized protein n=1 Tax=Microdochium trichocladiopsis TaxID=1682393 RepID=A0A9P8YJK1_9PEZI|nr:uncharacterized protein B0I36DRAFT_426712 [Microdochium trichocladiopsis]KAH7040209.1 hypothetical protein B0I36DRAFT_426712 [Microdochium trichocladiopsis]